MPSYFSKKDNFVFLLVGLLILLLTNAITQQFFSGDGTLIIEAATLFVLVGGIWSSRRRRGFFHTGLILALAFVFVFAIGLFMENDSTQLIPIILTLLFYLLAIASATRQVLFSGEVTTNTIIGSICIYFLLGLIWSVLFELLLVLDQNSFAGLHATQWHQASSELLYFSFVSITTMGFGDITPATPVAKCLTYLEGIVGQFYIAILVSSLVGVRLSRHSRHDNCDGPE